MIEYAKYAPISQEIFCLFFAHHIRVNVRSDVRCGISRTRCCEIYAAMIKESLANVIEALNTGRATQRIIEDMGLYSEELIQDIPCFRRVKIVQYWGIQDIAQRP